MPVNDGDARLLNIVTNSDFGSLISNPPSTLKNYVFKENITISSNIVVSDKLTFEPQDGAVFVKSGSGTITFSGIGIAAEDIGPYAQVFSGFAPGDVKWGDQMPSEIYATWFGLKAGSSTYAAANSAAMKVIQASFTRSQHEGLSATGEPSYTGTRVLFPIGKFYFSEELRATHTYTIEGVANNYHWGKGTMFLFPATGNGLHLGNKSTNPVEGRTSGFGFKNIDVTTHGDPPAPIAVNFVSGNKVTSVILGAFAFPHVNSGMTMTLPSSQFGIELSKHISPPNAHPDGTRIIDDATSTITLSQPTSDGRYTRIAFGAFELGTAFTAANVGDSLYLALGWARLMKITGFVNASTVDIEPILPFPVVANVSTGTVVSVRVVVQGFRGTTVPVRPYRRLMNVPDGAQTIPIYHRNGNPLTLDACFMGAKFSLPGSNFEATIDAINAGSFHINAPVPIGAGGALSTAQFSNLIGNNVSVVLNRFSGVRAIFGEHSVFENIRVKGFYGPGFLFDSLIFATGNVDHSSIRLCKADSNHGHGFMFIGTDTHELRLLEFDTINNQGYGIYDETGTGITVTGGHNSYNIGTIKQIGEVNQTVYKDIYTEGGSLGVLLARHGMLIGGTNAAGFQPDSEGAFSLTTYYKRGGISADGDGSQIFGARYGGYGLTSISRNGIYLSRLWGGNPAANEPILSGASAARGTLDQLLDADWSMYHSTEGIEFGSGYTKSGDYYIAGTKLGTTSAPKRAWHMRMAEIGDNTDNAKANFIQVFARTSEPSGGSYKKGSICHNINHDGTNIAYWVNTAENGSTWVSVIPTGEPTLATLVAAFNFNGAAGTSVSNWTNQTPEQSLPGMSITGASGFSASETFDGNGQSNLAPENVYRTYIYAWHNKSFARTISGLQQNKTYRCRLHSWVPASVASIFSATQFVFTANINGGTNVDFTVPSTKAIVKNITFSTSTGQTTATLNVNCGANNGIILSGMEILEVG